MSTVRFLRELGQVRTQGMASQDFHEINVSIRDQNLIKEAEQFLRTVVSYVQTRKMQIKQGETFGYGLLDNQILKGQVVY